MGVPGVLLLGAFAHPSQASGPAVSGSRWQRPLVPTCSSPGRFICSFPGPKSPSPSSCDTLSPRRLLNRERFSPQQPLSVPDPLAQIQSGGGICETFPPPAASQRGKTPPRLLESSPRTPWMGPAACPARREHPRGCRTGADPARPWARLLLKGAGGKETRGGRNLPWGCEQAARLWSPPRPRRASLGLDQTPRCCYCQRGGHSRSLEGPQTPLGSQTQPGSQNPLGFQIHPGSQTHLGSQTPPGSQTHSGSQTPMGSQPPPGSQTLPVPAATPGSREAGMSPCHFPARVYIPLRCRCR